MRAQFVETVNGILAADEDSVLLLGDIGVYGFREAFNDFPDRVFNIGILEQSTISLASGLSLNGLIPIVHTIAPFIVERALEQIKIDLCYQNTGCNLVSVGASYDYAALGCTHHCPGDINTLNQLPEMDIIVPGHAVEFDSIFSSSYNNGRPSYFRLSEYGNREPEMVKYGTNKIIKNGNSDIFVLVVGPLLDTVISALENEDVTLIYCTTVKPFDSSFISDNPRLKKLIIVEPYYSGSVLQNIIEAHDNIKFEIRMIGLERTFIENYGTKAEVDSLLEMDLYGITKRLRNAITG